MERSGAERRREGGIGRWRGAGADGPLAGAEGRGTKAST